MGELGRRGAARSFALVLTVAAVGRSEPTAIRIEYAAPAGCPDEAAFLEQVQRRINRARLARPGDLARTMKVTVDRAPSHSTARLEFVDVDARRVRREMSGEECVEVVNGIALVTALAMEERARGEAAKPQSPPAARSSQPPTAGPPPAPVLPPMERAAPRSGGVRWDVGFGLLTTSAVGPALLYGLGAFIALGPHRDARGVRLTLARLEGPTVHRDRGEAQFGLSMARLEACPLAWNASKVLAVVPCAAFDAGMIDASGSGDRVQTHETARVFWPVASAVGRFQLVLEDFLLFEGQGELGIPFKQDQSFVFREPNATVYDVPLVRWGLAASVGFRFE